MSLNIYKDADELSSAAALWIAEYISETLKSQDRFTIALSGGSTPKKLHQQLAAVPLKDKIDWGKIHFFWGDERAVPFDDERNNARMAFDTLLDQVPVNRDHIHIMRTDISPDAAAASYEELLHAYFDKESHSFDLVILGMGDDGHTLSLFPGYEVVQESERWALSFFLEEQDMYRITITAPVANLAAKIIFLVTGAGKAKALQQVLEGAYDPDTYPSQQIHPENGELIWFVDDAAAGLLTKD
ncbi:MAG: 6-phosphogluconolactonase [Terrimonas sp.]|nr:6-phosphogluconolactonase [Terrimonas sp.]